jgi:hypothetical protein
MEEIHAIDLRIAPRFDVTQLVELPEGSGVARNVSAQGIYFESPVPHSPGDVVEVTIAFHQGGERHELTLQGEVMRVEPLEGRVGIGARLYTPFFDEPGSGGT